MALHIWLIFLLVFFMVLPDSWFYKKMKQHGFYPWFRILSLLPLVLFALIFLYIRFVLRYYGDYHLTSLSTWVFIVLSIVYIPKITYISFYYFNRWFNRLFKTSTRFFRYFGFIIGLSMTAIVFYGLIITNNNFYVKHQIIESDEVPIGFDGLKIVVIGDTHLGNWNKRHSNMEKVVRLVNEENGDIIFFTGDLINNYSNEIDNWESYFKNLKCTSGIKVAVLGNHDYGDYTRWKSDEEKQINLEKTKVKIRSLGFDLLLNEHRNIVRNGDTITIVGVENFGSGHTHNYSDLPKAMKNTKSDRKKILLSHDPNHWEAEVVLSQPSIFLTVSGHTHAAQMGRVKRNFQISPASFVFHQWDGLYQKGDQSIYVNRGLGVVGVPLRIGVPPEITVLELRRKTK